MNEQITHRIVELGGDVNQPQASSLLEFVTSIEFPKPLFQKDEDGDLYNYGVYDFYNTHKDSYQNDPDGFFDKLILQHFSDDEAPRRQSFWRGTYFSPFTQGTPDYKEWRFDLDESNGRVNLMLIRKDVGDGELQFVQLTYAYGYPDHYYVCLQDPNPDNPAVYSTDHETFFDEIYPAGTLLEFFQNHYTQEEFRSAAKKYLANQAR